MSDVENLSNDAKHEADIIDEVPEATNNDHSASGEEDIDMDDLFGEESDEESAGVGNETNGEEEDEKKEGLGEKYEEEEEVADDSETEYQDEIKIAEAELPRHVIPYKTTIEESKIMQSRLPPFLKVDSKNFDPQQFLQKFNDRLNDPNLDTSDKTTLSLFDESTIRWRYTKDPKTGLITKESNATIVEWEDGSMSLKIGDEYCDIITNELECTLLVKTYPRANLLQTIGDAGIIKEKCMFVPATMKSNLHKRLAKAVQAQTNKENAKMGPRTVYMKNDPALELEKLEKQIDAVARAKRRDELKEFKRKEKEFERQLESGNAGEKSYQRKYKRTYDDDGFDRRGIDDEEEEEEEEEEDYAEDDFVVNDDDEEEEDEGVDEDEFSEDDDRKGDRLSKAKTGLAFKEADDEADVEKSVKKRKTIIEDDEE